MTRYVLTDEIWAIIEPLLPKPKGRHGKNDPLFIEAIIWITRTGAPWRDLPSDFWPWKTVYNRYNRWIKLGYLDQIFSLIKKKMGTTNII